MPELLMEKETYAIIGAAMEVHRVLGPGYLEAVYHEAMELELRERGIPHVSQPEIQIDYKGVTLQKYYIPDFLAYESIPVELKAFSTPLSEASQKQILNSLKCTGGRVGLLINFGRKSLDHRRFVM